MTAILHAILDWSADRDLRWTHQLVSLICDGIEVIRLAFRGELR